MLKTLQEVQIERDTITLEIDELLLQLKDPKVTNNEEILLKLHDKNNHMYDIAVAAIDNM